VIPPLLTALVSQRVVVDAKTAERRDALDQRWASFLQACGFAAIAMPNVPGLVDAFLSAIKPAAILLTGGNDLAQLGGDAPERDETETALIQKALALGIPLVGVCRGMQMIQSYFGVQLEAVSGHVMARQTITYEGRAREVNSYHRFGASTSAPELAICATASDGVVKAVCAPGRLVFGLMWHPERENPFRHEDISLIKDALRGRL
jgi:putative glutamine amidotransferase